MDLHEWDGDATRRVELHLLALRRTLVAPQRTPLCSGLQRKLPAAAEPHLFQFPYQIVSNTEALHGSPATYPRVDPLENLQLCFENVLTHIQLRGRARDSGLFHGKSPKQSSTELASSCHERPDDSPNRLEFGSPEAVARFVSNYRTAPPIYRERSQ